MLKRPVSIRPYRRKDLPRVMEIFQQAVWKGAPDYSMAQRRAWAPALLDQASWARFCTEEQVFVAKDKGTIAGFISLAEDGHINLFYVHPDHTRRGIGAKLLAHVLDQGLPYYYTEASMTARDVFERAGFNVIAPQTVSLRGQNFYNYRMEWQA